MITTGQFVALPNGIRIHYASHGQRGAPLVLWRMADIALPPALLGGLIDVVPQLDVERVARGTHWLIHEEPQFVANRILARFAMK